MQEARPVSEGLSVPQLDRLALMDICRSIAAKPEDTLKVVLPAILAEHQLTKEQLKHQLSKLFLDLARESGDALTGGVTANGVAYYARAAKVEDAYSTPSNIAQLATGIVDLSARLSRMSLARAAG